MKRLLILINNMSSEMAKNYTDQINDWLSARRPCVLTLPGLDPSIPVSIELIVVDQDDQGDIVSVERVGYDQLLPLTEECCCG